MAKYTLKDKVIVITGSTDGFELAITHALQVKGAKLALQYLDINNTENQVKKLGEESVTVG